MFIHLDLNWFQHPFPMKSFKITNQQQLLQLQSLKLKHILYSPSKSDLPDSQTSQPLVSDHTPEQATQIFDSIVEAKKARYEQLKKQRDELARCEEKFVKAAGVIRNINKNIVANPQGTIQEASILIDNIAESIFDNNDNIIKNLKDV